MADRLVKRVAMLPRHTMLSLVLLVLANLINVVAGSAFLRRQPVAAGSRPAGAGAVALVEEGAAVTHTANRTVALGAELDAILASDFGGSLADVIGRAKKSGEKRWSTAKARRRPIGLAYLQASVAFGVGAGNADSMGADDAKELVKSLSNELTALQKEIDTEHLSCQTEKRQIEARTEELRRAAGRASVRVAQLDIKISSGAGELEPSQGKANLLTERLAGLHKDCTDQHTLLKTRETEAMSEPNRARAFRKRALKSCTGAASAAALLEEVCKSPEGSVLDKPESAPPSNPNATKSSARADICIRDVRPTCTAIADVLEDMERTGVARAAAARRDLGALELKCQEDIANLNEELQQQTAHLSTAEEALLRAGGERSSTRLELKGIEQEMDNVVQRAKERNNDCLDAFDRFESEYCNLIETRQAMWYRFIKNEDEDTEYNPVRDCEVGDWTVGACSKTCSEEPGQSGVQLQTRPVIFEPGTETLEEELGARCPALTQSAPCADQACPVDCEMNSWSPWAECSRKCGGGEQLRTRSVQSPGLHGGKLCGVTVEAQSCNIGACVGDCTLGEWGSFGTCSKRCVFPGTSAGHEWRTKPVLFPAKPGGSCPKEFEAGRSESRECNNVQCPWDLEKLKCTAEQDVVMIIDGSASIAPSDEKTPSDANFETQKTFVEGLISNSELAGEDASDKRNGTRFGIVSVGSAEDHLSPKVVSLLSGDRKGLVAALQAAKPPKGQTDYNENSNIVGQAMIAAFKVLRVSGGDYLFTLQEAEEEEKDADEAAKRPLRHETVVFVTDGASRQPELTAKVARRMRSEGIRVVVVLVQNAGAPDADVAGRVLCDAASRPCSDNILRVDHWKDLNEHLGRFLATICPTGPTIEPPGLGPIA